eukprot:3468281-Prymnesium_polylepis.1
MADDGLSQTSATVRWNGGSHVFRVATDVNVRATFGSAAFLVDSEQRVVSLDESGTPLAPLAAGGAYTAFSGGSKELSKQVQ